MAEMTNDPARRGEAQGTCPTCESVLEPLQSNDGTALLGVKCSSCGCSWWDQLPTPAAPQPTAQEAERANEERPDDWTALDTDAGWDFRNTPPFTAQQEAERAFREWQFRIFKNIEPSGEPPPGSIRKFAFLAGYRRGGAEEREALDEQFKLLDLAGSRKLAEIVETERERDDLRAENARLREHDGHLFAQIMAEAVAGLADAAVVKQTTYTGHDTLVAVQKLRAKLAAAERELKWVGDVLAANGFPYSGPFGPGVCPLDEWLKDAEQREKRLLERIAEGEK